MSLSPPYHRIPEPMRSGTIQWLDHRLSALLATVLRGEDPYLQSNRYVYNAALEGSSMMARLLFEFLGVVPREKGMKPARSLKDERQRYANDFGLSTLSLEPATSSYFRSLGEEQFVAGFLWSINKRTAHCTQGTIVTGVAPADLRKASKIVLRELSHRFYGKGNPIEINMHLVRDHGEGWEGFLFKPPQAQPATP